MELLERHFDTAFDAPDGIKKLRELILTLAMQGKLMPQDSKDQPANELLKSIEAEKRRLVKEGKIKGLTIVETVPKGDELFRIPENWSWVRLGDLGITQTGTTPSSSNQIYYGNYIPFIGPGDIKDGCIDYSGKGLSHSGMSVARVIDANSLLMVCIGGSIGKRAINSQTVTCNQQINTLTPYKPISIRFLYWITAAPPFQSSVINASGGSATPIINKQKWSSIPTPLPPLAEQHRIVEKIDELMARCDALEKLRAERDAKRLAVHTAAVHQILNVASTDARIQACEFLSQHFGELYTVKENVTELRKAILQLAVMGKLVPQDPDDPPASELLKQIEGEKKRLVKEGKLRETKDFIVSSSATGAHSLPDGWLWTQLKELVAIVTDGDHQPPPKADRGVPFLVIGNLNRMVIDFADCRFVSREYYDALDWSRKPKRRDVLYTVTGSYGIPVVVDRDEEFCVQRHVAIFKSTLSTPVEYLSWVLRSDSTLGYATSVATGIAQKTVPLTGLRAMPVPLPPQPEQRRIVAKINQLMSLCDTLEQQIDAARGTQSALLNAVMAQYGGQQCA